MTGLTDEAIHDFLSHLTFLAPQPGEITPARMTAVESRIPALSDHERRVIFGIGARYSFDHGGSAARADASREWRVVCLIAALYLWDEFLEICPESCTRDDAALALADYLRTIDPGWAICLRDGDDLPQQFSPRPIPRSTKIH